MRSLTILTGLVGVANAACPYMTGELPGSANPHVHRRDDTGAAGETEEFLSQFYLNDQNATLTSDVGGPMEDQNSLSAGERGPTLLEDFIFRQKIQHFDHERVWHETEAARFSIANAISTLGSRTCCPCPWRWRPRCFHLIRRLV